MTDVEPGLCSGCAHSRRITSGKGGTFWLCRLSEGDPGFPRYPMLPVLRCRGYEPENTAEPDPRPTA